MWKGWRATRCSWVQILKILILIIVVKFGIGLIASTSDLLNPAYSVIEVENGSSHEIAMEKLTQGTGRRAKALGLNYTYNQKQLKKQYPTAIIIGFKKAGTCATRFFLQSNPLIVAPDPEMNYFNDKMFTTRHKKWYLNQMPRSMPWQMTIEKTPSYIIQKQAAKRIKNFNSKMKFIVVLRDPTTRLISEYAMVREGFLARNPKKNFTTLRQLIFQDKEMNKIKMNTDYIQYSLYYNHIVRWLKVFPRHQVHFVEDKELKKDPRSAVKGMEDFLKLDYHITNDTIYWNQTRGFHCRKVSPPLKTCLGGGKGREHPSIDPLVIKRLQDFFRPHNEKLYKLLNRTYDWD